MSSWQSHVLNPLLKLTVKRKLAKSITPADARKAFSTPMPPAKGARYTPGSVGGIAGEWVESTITGAGTMLYLHGGGYVGCSPVTHRIITGSFALQGFRVFCPAYRLAPESPFPAAVDDALASYRALAQDPAIRLVVAGDSAGGGLALAMLLAAKDESLPMPSCALLFSPWTDLACTGASLQSNAQSESMLVGPRAWEAAENYLQGADAKTPLASPLYGNLTGLPPLFIQVGAPEILLDDSTRLAARARAAGVTVDITIWENLPHVWHMFQRFLPEARLALDQAAAFAKTSLASMRADA